MEQIPITCLSREVTTTKKKNTKTNNKTTDYNVSEDKGQQDCPSLMRAGVRRNLRGNPTTVGYPLRLAELVKTEKSALHKEKTCTLL